MTAMRIFLIDAHALCYRSFYAIKGLRTKNGQATNAVFGFVNALRKILREFRPDYIAVCFDSKEKTNRQIKFAEYKIQRPVMPDDLISQIPIIKDVIKAFNLKIFEKAGIEADDLIATLAKKFASQKVEVVIVSDDKDLYQLASEQVRFLSSKQEKLIDRTELEAKLGFDPKKIVDFIALAGDSADNIPGVQGIGPVTARQLIDQFGNVEGILGGVDRIGNAKVRDKIITQEKMMLLSKELAQLDSEVPVEVGLEDLRVTEPQVDKLHDIFQELEFRKLAEEYSIRQDAVLDAVNVEPLGDKQIPLLINKIRSCGSFAFLGSLDGAKSDNEEIVFALGGNDVFSIPSKRIGMMKDIFESDAIFKVTYNFKEQSKILLAHELSVTKGVFDVMLGAYLLLPSRSSFQIRDLAWTYLNKPVPEHVSMAQASQLALDMATSLRDELDKKGLLKLLDQIEIPLSYVLAKVETTGVKVDLKLLKTLSDECDKKIKTLTKQIFQISGEEFNVNSPKQLGNILYEKLKLPTIKKTKTGFSTDEGVLTILAQDHEFPALILDYRQLSKLKSTYLDALPGLVNEKTGRIHADFLQTGTETGRLSSRHPNLQNIPIRTELGRLTRRAFVPLGKGELMVSADYSQIELRLLAHLSKDKNLIKAFKEDDDIHRYTASLIFDVAEQEVTDEMRDSAKRVNFGIIYGMSAFGLAKDLKISQSEAQEFIDRYFLRYPKVQSFMQDEITKCEEQGFVTTILNRRRYIPEINSKNVAIRQFAQRQAINTPVQGSAADLIKLAMINIQSLIDEKKLRSQMIITVHDELVFSVCREEADVMTKLIRESMQSSVTLCVPLKVSLKVGDNWLDLKEN